MPFAMDNVSLRGVGRRILRLIAAIRDFRFWLLAEVINAIQTCPV